MKKIISILLCVLLIASISGCDDLLSGIKESADNTTSSDTTPSDSSTTTNPSDTTATAVLSPESAIEIYWENRDLWMYEPEYMPMQRYGFCFLDLDFDGVLELIRSENDGSVRISYNKYFKINLSDYTVEEFISEDSDLLSDFDYYYLQENYTQLLKSNNDNKMFYYCVDYDKFSYNEYAEIYGKVYIENNEICTEKLFSEYHCPVGGLSYPEGADFFNSYENQESIEITEAEYTQRRDNFLNEHLNLNLVWKCVSIMEISSLSTNKQKEVFLDAYRTFSYDGFSFDNIETYDVDFNNFESKTE